MTCANILNLIHFEYIIIFHDSSLIWCDVFCEIKLIDINLIYIFLFVIEFCFINCSSISHLFLSFSLLFLHFFFFSSWVELSEITYQRSQQNESPRAVHPKFQFSMSFPYFQSFFTQSKGMRSNLAHFWDCTIIHGLRTSLNILK
jgi:hypothetical protein